jgi:hypothetical protein
MMNFNFFNLSPTNNNSIALDRKTIIYRLLESSLALFSIGSIFIYILVVIIEPVWAAIFLISYGMLWTYKFFLNVLYTLYSFKQYNRWKNVDWDYLVKNFNNYGKTYTYLQDLRDKYPDKIDWTQKIDNDIASYNQIQNTKFINIEDTYHVTIFATYNESSEVLAKSLKYLYNSKWAYKKLLIIVSQEARRGLEGNKNLRDEISRLQYVQTTFLDDTKNLNKIKISDTKLNVFFTEHPDGLVGEIKGKASNEDWGARQALKLINAQKIDIEMTLVTSLDSDSHITPYFFHNLSFRYCLTLERNKRGFQPVHSYSNNFFKIGLFPRQVATQTTLYNLTNLALDGEIYFFAIYSVPMSVLIEVDFWEREVIAEDYLLFIKCFTHFKGQFKVLPHYGVFEGDAVEASSYIEEIINQYKQLQRWAWGGVEGFPYLFKRLFLVKESKDISLIDKLKWIYLKFSNHFFWVTTPIIFSVGPLIPQFIHGEMFQSSNIAQNMVVFSQYFAWISFIFIFAFGYLTFVFIAKKATDNQKLSYTNIIIVLLQLIISPFIYGLMAIPAVDAQLRGLLGKYMGYWVTPKS